VRNRACVCVCVSVCVPCVCDFGKTSRHTNHLAIFEYQRRGRTRTTWRAAILAIAHHSALYLAINTTKQLSGSHTPLRHRRQESACPRSLLRYAFYESSYRQLLDSIHALISPWISRCPQLRDNAPPCADLRSDSSTQRWADARRTATSCLPQTAQRGGIQEFIHSDESNPTCRKRRPVP
jgi:hypothetical protein